MNTITKYVVSSTLKSADWTNTTLINSDVADQIHALKQQPGQSIGVSGSPTLVEFLIEHHLLDELRLLVFPVVVGHGRRLLRDDRPSRGMELLACSTFQTGVVDLTYRPAAN